MARVRVEMEFPWPSAVVWPYLAAFEQVPTWEDDVLDVRVLGGAEPAVGTRLIARRVYAGRETRLDGTIVELERGHHATLELRGGPLALARATYAVDPDGPDASVVTYTGTVHLRGFARLMTPLTPLMGRIQVDKNLRRLQRRIAAGIPPTADIPTPD